MRFPNHRLPSFSVCLFIYVHTYNTSTNVHLHVHIHVSCSDSHAYTHIYIYTHMHTYACVYVCTHVDIYINMYLLCICKHIFRFISLSIHLFFGLASVSAWTHAPTHRGLPHPVLGPSVLPLRYPQLSFLREVPLDDRFGRLRRRRHLPRRDLAFRGQKHDATCLSRSSNLSGMIKESSLTGVKIRSLVPHFLQDMGL